MTIKSFRGKMLHNTSDIINLHTNNGSMGYKITKFQLMDANPSAASNEFIIKIFTIPQTTINGDVDFDDNTLLAAGFLVGNTDTRFDVIQTVLFDNMKFNQDIYITCFDNQGNNGACNYYIELETSKLDLNENTVATLKDIKNIEQSRQ